MSRNTLPFVTVIMPVRNEAGYIDESLGAVLAQDYPPERMEVIVADGMSNDGTREKVESFVRGCENLRLIDNPNKIASTALNNAINEARGEIIVRVDGHCVVASSYVRMCVQHLLHDGVDGVGGPIETIAQTYVARVIAVAMSSPFGVGDSTFRIRHDRTQLADTVPFPAYWRAAIERAGAYDEEQIRNQDDEYNYRLRKQGAKILLSSDIKSKYYSRATLRSLWKQYFEYGFWKVRVMQKHPKQMRPRQFVPAAFVLLLLSSFLAALFASLSWWPFVSVGRLYAIANIVASASSGFKHSIKLLPLLPVAFATLHIAYGFGFVVGLFRFAHRWGDAGKTLRLKPRAQADHVTMSKV